MTAERAPKLQPDPKLSPDSNREGGTGNDNPRDLYVIDGLSLLQIAKRYQAVPGFSYSALRRMAKREDWDGQYDEFRRKRNSVADGRAVETKVERSERHGGQARRLVVAAERVLGHIEGVLARIPTDMVVNIGTANALADALSKVSATVERCVKLEVEVAPQARDPFGDVFKAAEAAWDEEESMRSKARNEAIARAKKLVDQEVRGVKDDSPSTPRRGGPLPEPPPGPPREDKPRRRGPRKLPGF